MSEPFLMNNFQVYLKAHRLLQVFLLSNVLLEHVVHLRYGCSNLDWREILTNYIYSQTKNLPLQYRNRKLFSTKFSLSKNSRSSVLINMYLTYAKLCSGSRDCFIVLSFQATDSNLIFFIWILGPTAYLLFGWRTSKNNTFVDINKVHWERVCFIWWKRMGALGWGWCSMIT